MGWLGWDEVSRIWTDCDLLDKYDWKFETIEELYLQYQHHLIIIIIIIDLAISWSARVAKS